MKTTTLLAAILAATSALRAEHKFPLPEFQSPEQLVQWRRETMEKARAADTQAAAAPATFYTGKPYLEETGSYAFKYRQYDPELARWTTFDPSGFPDGANGIAYMPVPTSEFDWQGLKKIAWVYYTPSAFHGSIVSLLNANISIVKREMEKADREATSGEEPHYLDDDDVLFASTILVDTAAAINNLFSTYDKLVLVSHGSYFQNQYYWGGATNGHLTTVFGSNASNIYYATCFNYYSPNPTNRATGITQIAQILPSVKDLTKNYLYE